MYGTAIIGTILGALGLVIIVGFCGLLWKNLPFGKNTSFSWRLWVERAQFKRAQKALAAFEQAYRAQQLKLARSLLPQAIVPGRVQANQALAEDVSQHHLDLLDLLVRLGDEHSKRIENVGTLESLFLRRASILRESAEVRRGQATLAARRRTKGKEAPGWALEDFQRRQAAIVQELRANSLELRQQLVKALESLEREAGQSITYH